MIFYFIKKLGILQYYSWKLPWILHISDIPLKILSTLKFIQQFPHNSFKRGDIKPLALFSIIFRIFSPKLLGVFKSARKPNEIFNYEWSYMIQFIYFFKRWCSRIPFIRCIKVCHIPHGYWQKCSKPNHLDVRDYPLWTCFGSCIKFCYNTPSMAEELRIKR